MFDMSMFVVVFIMLGLLALLPAAIKVVPEYKRIVVLRPGKSIGARTRAGAARRIR